MTTIAPEDAQVRPPVRIASLYAGMVRAEMQAASTYRAQLVLSVLAWVVPLAFLTLWRSAAADGPVGGITATQFSTYFCLLLVTTNLQLSMPVIFDFGWLVYSGQMSALLVRPCHPVHQVIARAIAEKVYVLPGLAIIVPVALVLTGGRSPAPRSRGWSPSSRPCSGPWPWSTSPPWPVRSRSG